MGVELIEFLKKRKKMNLLMTVINVCVFLVLEILGNTNSVQFMFEHGAMYVPAVVEGKEYYRLFTCMFLHFGAEHLTMNMLLLLFAGDMLEERVGIIRYLIIYLGGGLAGNLLSLAVSLQTGEFAVSAGASGAIFAVIGALICIVWKHHGNAPGINGRGLMAMAALNLAQGFFNDGVDGMAHLGGAIGGFILALLLYRRKKEVNPWEYEG